MDGVGYLADLVVQLVVGGYQWAVAGRAELAVDARDLLRREAEQRRLDLGLEGRGKRPGDGDGVVDDRRRLPDLAVVGCLELPCLGRGGLLLAVDLGRVDGAVGQCQQRLRMPTGELDRDALTTGWALAS